MGVPDFCNSPCVYVRAEDMDSMGMGGGYGGMGGYGGGNGGSGDGYGMQDRCCEKKFVNSDENPEMNGYYVLLKRAEWYDVPDFCNSPCVYVRAEDMDSMGMGGNGTGMGGYGSGSMGGSGYGSDSGMGGKDDYDYDADKMIMMMRLQKYCFKQSENTQAMCASDLNKPMGGGM